MANINKIRLSGQTYNIEDASLKSDIYITSDNRNSIQSVIKEGVYSLSSDDVYTIVGTKENSTDRIQGLIIVNNTPYNFTGSTSSDVEGVSALAGVVTFDLSTNFSITLVNRNTDKINELFIEGFTSYGEESSMSNITITHNPAIGANKVDYIASLYTEFVHEKYALADDLSSKQDTLVSGTNIKTVNNQSLLGSGNITIQGGGGATVIEATQAEYDAASSAGTLDLTALYIITDAQSLDIRDYWTSAQTESAISQATSGKANSSDVYLKTETSGATEISTALNGKQDTLVSSTNIKTINNESILGSGNINIQGGGDVTVDTSLDSSSTNAVANSAVSAALNYNNMFLYRVDPVKSWDNHPTGTLQLRWRNPYNGSTATTQDAITLVKINNIPLIADSVSGIYNLNLVETSAITTLMSSASTDSQVPSAKAVNDKLGGLSIVKLTESEYTALVTKDSNTLYVVVPDPSN